ncbi:Nuclear cap-binding protein subunit 2 [Platanthera guangdongensis]|uniref:Nuclear cap-binding protein subunit 2 n=1 Tax=Platanthera guangdongensis TaxID=2320717 RepID=A0ABR2LXQ5_9ASPA
MPRACASILRTGKPRAHARPTRALVVHAGDPRARAARARPPTPQARISDPCVSVPPVRGRVPRAPLGSSCVVPRQFRALLLMLLHSLLPWSSKKHPHFSCSGFGLPGKTEKTASHVIHKHDLCAIRVPTTQNPACTIKIIVGVAVSDLAPVANSLAGRPRPCTPGPRQQRPAGGHLAGHPAPRCRPERPQESRRPLEGHPHAARTRVTASAAANLPAALRAARLPHYHRKLLHKNDGRPPVGRAAVGTVFGVQGLSPAARNPRNHILPLYPPSLSVPLSLGSLGCRCLGHVSRRSERSRRTSPPVGIPEGEAEEPAQALLAASPRSVNRAAPYSVPRAPDSAWHHDMFADQMPVFQNPTTAARATAIETGTKLYISNLDYGVSNEDIKELFSEVGDLKRCSIHYDRSGRSKGTAEVVFSKRADALAAVKRYNNVQLDGKPMKIEIVGTNIQAPITSPQVLNGNFGNYNPFPRREFGVALQLGRELICRLLFILVSSAVCSTAVNHHHLICHGTS